MKTTKRITAADAAAMARRDRNRLIGLVVGVVLVGGAYFASVWVEQDRRDEGPAVDVDRPPPRERDEPRVELIEYDGEGILEQIRDATDEDRVLVEPEALKDAFDYGRLQAPAHFEALGIRDLTAEVEEELEAAPDEHRLDALRARGRVIDVERRRRGEGPWEDWFGTLQREDGGYAHFLVVEAPRREDGERRLEEGDFLRVDGVFYKLFRREVDGVWRDGPFVTGHAAYLSSPSITAEESLEPGPLADVRDDTLEDISGVPRDAKWHLMARAKLASDETDWEAVPTLDTGLLRAIFEDGERFRGEAFTIPLSTNLGTWTEAAEENPLRLERITRGWIGNFLWKDPVAAIQFVAPHEWDHLYDWQDEQAARYVRGKAYFLKNVVYTKRDGNPGRSPLFVVADIEVQVPQEDALTAILMWVVLGLTLFVVVAIFLLLRQDARKSRELQERMLRRKRERRAGVATAGADTP